MINNCTALILVWESGIIKNVLLPTCEILRPYCSKIIISHCGPRDQMFLYNDYKHIDNLVVNTFDYKGNAEHVIVDLISMVPKNEWALLLDSDHRPCPILLEKLNSSIEFFNRNGHNICSLPTHHHEFKGTELTRIPQSSQPQEKTPDLYVVNNFFKADSTISCQSNNGMHYGMQNTSMHYLPYSINHYKLYFEYFSSAFLCGYSFPPIHSFSKREHELDALNKENYIRFEELKSKLNMPTSNEFKTLAYRKEIPLEFVEFFSNPNFSKNNNRDTTHFLNNAHHFCIDYGFSFEESMKHKRFCGGECCKYKDIQL